MSKEDNSARSGPAGGDFSGENRLVGVSLVGGGVAWLMHLLLAYLVAEFGCLAGLDEVRFLGITAVAWMLVGVSLLAFGGGTAATLLSWRIWQRQKARLGTETEDAKAGEFAAGTALIANLIFVFVILVESIPIVYFLHDC
jgi:hypothetical protein